VQPGDNDGEQGALSTATYASAKTIHDRDSRRSGVVHHGKTLPCLGYDKYLKSSSLLASAIAVKCSAEQTNGQANPRCDLHLKTH
jgi:hypothetical protein